MTWPLGLRVMSLLSSRGEGLSAFATRKYSLHSLRFQPVYEPMGMTAVSG